MGMAALLDTFPCGKWQAKLPYVPHGVDKLWHRQGTVVGTSEHGGQALLASLPPPEDHPPGVWGLKIGLP